MTEAIKDKVYQFYTSKQGKITWRELESFIDELIHQRDGDRTAEVADVILGAMRSYRLRFPDANYDDAIGVVMGYKIPYTPTGEESR